MSKPPIQWMPFLACMVPAAAIMVFLLIMSWDKSGAFWAMVVLCVLVFGTVGYAVDDHYRR